MSVSIQTWRADPVLPGVHLLRLVSDPHEGEQSHLEALLPTLLGIAWDASRGCWIVRAVGVVAACRAIPELADLVTCGAEVRAGQVIHPRRR